MSKRKKSLKEHLNADMQKVITFADFFACKFFLLLSRRFIASSLDIARKAMEFLHGEEVRSLHRS